MDQSFSQAVAEWQGFYTFVGSAAATLLGLLFVAVQLRLNIFREAQVLDIRDLAIQVFLNFSYLVLMSSLFLIPRQSPPGLGLPLVVLGILGIGWLVYFLRQALPLNQGKDPTRWAWRLLFTLWFATYAGLIAVALVLLGGNAESLFWLAAVDVALLVTATVGAWALMTHGQASS